MAGIRKVDYYAMKVAHRPGSGSALLETMKSAGVNLLAFHGFPEGRRAQVDLVPQNGAKFRRAARKAGWKLPARKTAFLAQGVDRVGALTGVMRRLAAARINVVALTAVSAGAGRFGSIFWVKPAQAARAARLLRAR
jgi:hypothetical protein